MESKADTKLVIDQVFQDLAAPFPPDQLDWRVGATTQDKTKGLALPYLDARAVQRRLDDVIGPPYWETDLKTGGERGLIRSLTIHVGDRTVTRTDAAGWTTDSDGDPGGMKGAASDSLKRAAALFGVGRYLYDLPRIWVAIEQKGRSYVLKTTPTLPAWALPAASNGQHIDEGTGEISDGEAADAGFDPQGIEEFVERLQASDDMDELNGIYTEASKLFKRGTQEFQTLQKAFSERGPAIAAKAGR